MQSFLCFLIAKAHIIEDNVYAEIVPLQNVIPASSFMEFPQKNLY